ncbi:c-type cytochrome [Magnetospirillum sp. SS-4]|uniref:c-type cytochrome n=1 Tax=Magnetospirillum sp. SS-4 TaxID=2681465 RepID=UPI00138437B1|nr:c-type cytochrome [Magnetospirillum sp. SS-4]CAA7615527.1 Cytochrome c553 [Magnetospirillum sp. SS-4]
MFKFKYSLAVAAAVSALLAGGAAHAADVKPTKGKSLGEEGYVWHAGGGEEDAALTLKPDLNNGREVYEVCSACHQPEGWGLTDGTFPQLAGQHAKVTIKQLADIRALNRDNPTMYPFALPSQIGGPQAIADVAAYMAKLPMNPEPGVGDGKDLAHGKKLYEENCTRCHGVDGAGDNDKFYPRIQGQHYNYLVRQYQWIKEGKRRNANPDMMKQIQAFTDRDTKAVLDYTSRLKPPANLTAPKGWKNPDFQ